MLIDTHKAVERMIKSGLSKEQSEVIIDEINSSSNEAFYDADAEVIKYSIHNLQSKIDEIQFKMSEDRSGFIDHMISIKCSFLFLKIISGIGVIIIIAMINSMKI